MTVNNPTALTQDEILAEIDHIARTRLGMSGYQLLELHQAGCLADPDLVVDAIMLAQLLEPFPQPAIRSTRDLSC